MAKYAATDFIQTLGWINSFTQQPGGITQIAKLIKRDLKTNYPSYTFSVRTRRYSGGQSLDIVVVRFPEAQYPSYQGRLTLLRAIKSIPNAYNFDDCDLMTDYFHVRFFCSVDFASDIPPPQDRTWNPQA